MKLNLKKICIVSANPEQLKQSLVNASRRKKLFNYKIDKASENRFCISARTSLGVVTAHGFNIFKPISIFGNISCISGNKLMIDLRTRLRPEIIVLSIASVIAYVLMIINFGTFPAWLFCVPGLVVVWFFFIYRQQEKSLLSKIVNELRLLQNIP